MWKIIIESKVLRFKELREKHRKEQVFRFENYVEGGQTNLSENVQRRLDRIQHVLGTMLKKSRLNYYQVMRKRQILAELLRNNALVYHGNFCHDASLHLDLLSTDSFAIHEGEDEDAIGGETDKSKQNIPSLSSSVLGLATDRASIDRDKRTLGTPEKRHHRLGKARKSSGRSSQSRQETKERKTKPRQLIRRKSDSSRMAGGMSKLELKTQNLVVVSKREKVYKKRAAAMKVHKIELQEQNRVTISSVRSKPKERSNSVFFKSNPLYSGTNSLKPGCWDGSISPMGGKQKQNRIKSEEKKQSSIFSANESLNTSTSRPTSHTNKKKMKMKTYIDKQTEPSPPSIRRSSSHSDEAKFLFQAIANCDS